VIIGYISGKPSRIDGVKALFNSRLSDKQAVLRFLSACRKKPPKQLVRLNNRLHTTVIAPSGAGKNVSIVEPFLFDSSENCICIDIKGENARITSEHRARAFSHNIVMIDPFKLVTETPSTFNVIEYLDPLNPTVLDEIRAIAEAIVIKEPNSRDPHWQQKAEIYITGAIASVVHFCPPTHRSLQEVAEIMADKSLLKGAIQALQNSNAHGGLLARLGNEMSLSTDKELDGILSTANRSLTVLSTPAVVESTKAINGFNPSALSDSKVTVYLILPHQYIRSHAGLMRLWVTALMRSVVSRGVINPRPVNVILDECAALGHLEAIEDMLTIGRGFGLKIIAVFQSMSQIKKVFPEGQEGVLLSNSTQIFWRVSDHETAEHVRTRLGEQTIIINSGGSGDGRSYQSSQQGQNSSSYSTNSSYNWSQHGRSLLTAAEVTALNERVAITFTPGLPPIRTRLVRYYEKEFKEAVLKPTPGMGLWRSAFDTACLFLLAVMIAVLSTGIFLKQLEGNHVESVERVFRARQGRKLRKPTSPARPVAKQVLQRRGQ